MGLEVRIVNIVGKKKMQAEPAKGCEIIKNICVI
jgi:hypothetical protein